MRAAFFDLRRNLRGVLDPVLRREAWKRVVFAFQITLERRLWLFLGVDAVLALQGTLDSLVAGGQIDRILSQSVFLPTVLLCLPALSGSVALERRAGSLDLALSLPSTERYFLWRVLPISGLFALQGGFFLTFSYIETSGGLLKALAPNLLTGGFLRSLVQCLLLHLFITALVLFWAVRLRTGGGVWIASFVTVWIFRPALVADPMIASDLGYNDFLLGIPRPLLSWIGAVLVAGLAALMFYLYARERLRRPETLLD